MLNSNEGIESRKWCVLMCTRHCTTWVGNYGHEGNPPFSCKEKGRLLEQVTV